ncbi:MAG: signal peptidase II [Cyanobacteria bacterium]|nr:signal peptidase II [Cyanobacteriota bacterium]
MRRHAIGRSALARRLGPWIVASAVVGLDQLSKAWALSQLGPGQTLPWLPGLLQLQRVANTGAAFSLFSGNSAWLGLVSALVTLLAVGWLVWQPPARPWQVLALALLLAGALGNGLDRWRLGYVVDFLEFVPVQFPIFNVADVAINLAVACFAIDWLRSGRHLDG